MISHVGLLSDGVSVGEIPMAEEPKGWFDADTVSAYLSEDPTREYYSRNDVYYFRTEPAKLHPIKVCDENNVCYSPQSIGQCLCLDVGSWTGSGQKSVTTHQMHREFGVVCGSIAALCSFRVNKEKVKHIEERVLEQNLGKKYTNKIGPFIEFISTDPNLGRAVVLNALEICDGAIADDPKIDTETLHVFLGDLHLPAVTDVAANKIGGSSHEDFGEVFERAGRLQLDAEVQKLFDDMSSLIKLLVAEITFSLINVAASGPFMPISAPKNVLRLKDSFLKRFTELEHKFEQLAALESIEAAFPNGEHLMPEAEIDKWFEFYYGDACKKGADIFQSAGSDLVIFLDLLKNYQEKNAGSKMNFVQLGDCCDFWIGMKCGMKDATSSNPDQSGVVLQYDGPDFARYWYEKTKQSNVSGKVLDKLEDLAKNPAPNINVTLLYGNHDNYLKHTHGRKEQYLPDGIVCAEHGHQSDSFNCDTAPVSGWALTQVAFVIPEIRELEDPLAVALTLGKRLFGDDPGARLQRIARAADFCIDKKRLIYVMAHTYRPMLKRITIRQGIDPMSIRKSHAM
jgi:hypothetical protein